jgi:hypothetical protein
VQETPTSQPFTSLQKQWNVTLEAFPIANHQHLIEKKRKKFSYSCNQHFCRVDELTSGVLRKPSLKSHEMNEERDENCAAIASRLWNGASYRA